MTGYLGLPPSGYAKPLELAQNLNDVPDKAAALLNLGAASAEDVLRAANPIGTIIAFYGSVAPSGYLPCSGQSVSSTIFPELVEFLNPGNSSATLPDLRGEFLRGWDNGRGIDSGRAIKTAQLDSLKSHSHTATFYNVANAAYNNGFYDPTAYSPTYVSTNTPVSMNPSGGGAETRPRNIAVLYCIKAYGVIVNQGSVDVAAIAAQTDLKVALTQFTGTNQNLTANGHQKLPGGLIIQWGVTGFFAADSTTYVTTFPITFPTACLIVTMTDLASTTNAAVPKVSVRNPGSFSASQYQVLSSAVSHSYNYIALGY